MFKIFLHKRIIVSDRRILEAERELEMPIPPCIGLRLYNTEWTPPDCDESEDEIELVAWDVITGQIHCYLPLGDFRYESSGGHWTESDIRGLFQEWVLKPDMPILTRSQNKYPTTRRGRRSHGSE